MIRCPADLFKILSLFIQPLAPHLHGVLGICWNETEPHKSLSSSVADSISSTSTISSDTSQNYTTKTK